MVLIIVNSHGNLNLHIFWSRKIRFFIEISSILLVFRLVRLGRVPCPRSGFGRGSGRVWCSPAAESVAQGRSRSQMLPQHPHVSYPCARRAGGRSKRSRRPPGGRSPNLDMKKSTNGVTYCSTKIFNFALKIFG